MDQYLSALDGDIGILEYWQVTAKVYAPFFNNYLTLRKANQIRYPHIFQLAMDILPIQATSVPCERAFSSGKETMAAWHRRISADLMEALQMLKYSVHKGPSLNFTEGMPWNDELKEFEYMARTAPSQDPDAYSKKLSVAEQDGDELEVIIEEVTKSIQEQEELEKRMKGQEVIFMPQNDHMPFVLYTSMFKLYI